MGFSKSLKLYKYQLDAVNWMKSIEVDVDMGKYKCFPLFDILTIVTGFDFTEIITWPSGRIAVLFDTKQNLAVPLKDLPKHKKKVFPRGGILADEMGLGYFSFTFFLL